jgi:hypothetical protein
VSNIKQSRTVKRRTSDTPPDTFLRDMATVKFSGRKIDISKIDHAWKQQRGAMMRIALLVMRDDDKQLSKKFSKTDADALMAMKMANQLQDEAEFLKEGIKILTAAMSRLMTVSARRELANIRAKAVTHGR